MSEEAHRDYAGAKLGMWLFLFTEIILFGGLFVLYAVYLNSYPDEFVRASHELSIPFGAVNTVVLLTSSLFVAVSVSAIQQGKRRLVRYLLAATILAAVIFLINKYFEWTEKFDHGIYPNSPLLLERPPGEIVFFGLYFITTGLHALHVLIGAGLIAWVLWLVRGGRVHHDDYIALENSGLYWHLVDLIWIFIFPLYYLIL
jgi:cytochrome c oxidase subunit III